MSFLSSRPFHENFKFLKNCPYDFHKILHGHSTPKGAPACAKASKSYDWNVRNIAKISPKMAKIDPKQPFFDFFRFSQKLSIRFKRIFLQSFYTILESYMCNGIKIVWLGCEQHSQNYPKNGQKTAIFRLFLIFAKTVCMIRTKISTVIFYTIVWSMCAISINSYNWDWSESEGKRPKPTPLPHMRLWFILVRGASVAARSFI